MSAERWGALPLGELHAEGVCYRCGIGGQVNGESHLQYSTALKRTIDRATLAVAHVCIDTIACERRRYRRRNP